MASNLLASYRYHSDNASPFSLICDERNEYTKLFDDVVIMENPRRSYLDKLSLPKYAPYDETIFIDADCLAYRDLNDLWPLFEGPADFTALGVSYPTSYPYAWFKIEDVGDYSDGISFIPDFIGGVYYIRQSEQLEVFSNTCADILENFDQFTFRQFTKPADEPIIALAMAVHGFRPVDRRLAPVCFYPHSTFFRSNIATGTASYVSKYEQEHDEPWDAYLVHWVNGITSTPVYKREVARLRHAMGDPDEFSAWAALVGSILATNGKRILKPALSRLGLLELARSLRMRLQGS